MPGVTKATLPLQVLQRVLAMNGRDVSGLTVLEKRARFRATASNPVALELLDNEEGTGTGKAEKEGGTTGKDGKNGKDGKDGKEGKNGKEGKDGKDGTVIAQPGTTFGIGDWVDCQDEQGRWWIAQIIDISDRPKSGHARQSFKVRFSSRTTPPDQEAAATATATATATTAAATTTTAAPSSTASAAATTWWEWENDEGAWSPYDPQANLQIEQACTQGSGTTVRISAPGGGDYHVEMTTSTPAEAASETSEYLRGVQTNMQTHHSRRIRRALTAKERQGTKKRPNKQDSGQVHRSDGSLVGPPPSDLFLLPDSPRLAPPNTKYGWFLEKDG